MDIIRDARSTRVHTAMEKVCRTTGIKVLGALLSRRRLAPAHPHDGSPANGKETTERNGVVLC